MRIKILSTTLCSLILAASTSVFAQVEQVTSVTVTNQDALIATISQYQETGESEMQSVTLLTHMMDGTDPSTHTIVALYDNLEDLESTLDGRTSSAAWGTLLRSFPTSATANSSLLAIQRRSFGDDSWSEGDYLSAVLLQGSDPAFLAAIDDWESTSEVDNPGMIRVMRLRGATGASHAVLISSSSYEDLINFQEEVEYSDAFATLQAAQAATPITTLYYRVTKIWNP